MSDKERDELHIKLKRRKWLKFILKLIISCTLIFSVYRVSLDYLQPELVLTVYMAVATALIAFYVIYNRGFSRRGITRDMLPESWDEEKKDEFLRSAEERIRRSQPVLVLIVGFIFTFFIDIIEIIAIPYFMGIFGG